MRVSVEFAPPMGASGTLTDKLSYDFTCGSNDGTVAVALSREVK